MIKVIVVGDPHFKTDNGEESSIFVERLEKLIIAENPDMCVILGDVLHTHERLHTTPYNDACDFIRRVRDLTPTYVLVGNHDQINNQQYLNSNHWMNPLKEWENVTIVDTVVSKRVGDNMFYFVPFVPPGRFVEALETNPGWQEADCIFAHQEFFGCSMGAISSVDGDKWPETNPYVVSGHIHSRQTLQPNLFYPGSAMQHAFGESEKNIIPVFTFNEEGFTKREIDLKLPRKKTLYMDVQEIDDFVVPSTEDTYKVTLSGNYDQFKAFRKTKKFKSMTKAGLKVVFKPRKIKKTVQDSEKHEEEAPKSQGFQETLRDLVMKEKDPRLAQAYEAVVNSKDLGVDDILFL
jgi:DNA repair exonuclease SbcCD nuclease subunit